MEKIWKIKEFFNSPTKGDYIIFKTYTQDKLKEVWEKEFTQLLDDMARKGYTRVDNKSTMILETKSI